jgi:hypothetical protein
LLGFFFPSTRDAEQQPSILLSTEVTQSSLDFLLHWFPVIVSPTAQQEASCSNPLPFPLSGQSDNTLVHPASSEQQLVAACHLSSILFLSPDAKQRPFSSLSPKISKQRSDIFPLFVLLV